MTEEKKYWDPEAETMPIDKLRRLQGERLQELVAYAYEKTKFYRRKFDEADVKPSDIQTIDDLKKLPLIEDDEIRNAPLEDKLSVPWIQDSDLRIGVPSKGQCILAGGSPVMVRARAV